MTDLRAQLQATLGEVYTLDRELGGGGMSRVFLATKRALLRPALEASHAMSMSVQRVCRALSLLVAVAACDAPTPHPSQDRLDRDGFVRHEVASRVLKATREVVVALPDRYAAPASRFPVLIILDADDQPQFRAAVANAQFLASRGKVPAFIVVGIANGKDRTHELMPAAEGADVEKEFATAGGDAENLKYITDEVLQWVDSTYRTEHLRVIAGHSFGGVFVINALIKRPDVFRVGLAMSPSLWWNDNALVNDLSAALAKDTVHDRTLFVTSGGREEGIDVPARAFVDVMRGKHLRRMAFSYQRYPQDEHLMTPQPSLIDGLRTAFAPLVVDAQAMVDKATHDKKVDTLALRATLVRTEAEYAAHAASFGLPPAFPESALNALGLSCLSAGARHFAISLLKTNTERYPLSANTYDSFGEALIAVGDTVAARSAYQRAIDVAATTNDPVGRESLRKLTELNAHK